MPLKTQLEDAPAPNLTPMIDVVFLLIIFFMVGTNFTQMEHKITVNIPEVDAQLTALTPKPARRIVTVHQDGSLTLDGAAVSLTELEAKLRDAARQYKELAVTVRGAANGLFGNVAQVLSQVRQAGVSEMDISVRPSSRSRR